MKRLTTFIMSLLIAVATFAIPQGFTYQAVVRDAAGSLVQNNTVGVKISLLAEAANGVAVYAETHKVKTNDNGLLTLTIGQGTTSGDFSAIDWSTGIYFLHTQIDPLGGVNYTISSVQQLMSVPYALYAAEAGSGGSGSEDLQEVVAKLSEKLMPRDPGFSIHPKKRIQFAPGNLQYQASTGTWRFAARQYDMIGSANSNMSASYSGWIDLFGWGTGNNPTNISTSNLDYSTFVDWGTNTIQNGNNIEPANTWRTLTISEWHYLLNVRANAASLHGAGCVNGVNGYVLLPDNWQWVAPLGIDFVAQALSYTDNTYTLSQWMQLETAGAVFLPAAGDRNGSYVSGVGSGGYYWSSTPYGAYDAYNMDFNQYYLYTQYDYSRYYGYSVRLVRTL